MPKKENSYAGDDKGIFKINSIACMKLYIDVQYSRVSIWPQNTNSAVTK